MFGPGQDFGRHPGLRRFAGPGAAAAAALVLAWLSAGCSSYRTFEIASRGPEHPIVIDGKPDDWAGHLFAVKGQKVSLGFLNDSQNLYVCLRTDDPGMMRQFLRSGLMIWFDPEGGRKKVLGIRHPVGLPPDQRRMWRVEEPRDAEEPLEFEGDVSELEIHRSGQSEPEKMDIADLRGIEIRASFAGKRFVYELEIPLIQTSPDSLALGARPGGTIGIGIETGKSDLGDFPRRGAVGSTGALPPTGAFGGFGSRGGYGRQGRLRPNEPVLPENLKLWATVRLGKESTPFPAAVQSVR